MRALVRLLVRNTQIFSLNLGERGGVFFTPREYEILSRAVEAGCTGLALGWVEYGETRFLRAVNENRRRIQSLAREAYSLTRSAPTAMSLVPWRDGAYRDRLVASCGLGEYTAMGQHHVRQLERWGEGRFASMDNGEIR